MLKIFSRNLVLLCSLCVLGCTKVGIHARPYADTTDETPVGKLDFGWRLSGDRSVAPLQIFSDATRIWLQWGSQQTLPALIGLDEHGERVLPYRLQGPYAVIDGRWTQLQFRAGSLLARARRVAEPRAGGAVTTPPPQPIERTPVSLSVVYAVTPKDLHLRQALGRWASIADWRFQPDHWVVDVDIPLTAGAEFTDNFIDSVRALVRATELSDRPLQPCFYSNRVLRIVPLSEHCDRTTEQGTPV